MSSRPRTEVDPAYDRRRGQQELLEAIPRRCRRAELRLGFDDAHVTVRQHARLRELLPERVELVAAGGLVERLRAVKEPEEIERIRAATAAADAALQQILAQAAWPGAPSASWRSRSSAPCASSGAAGRL